MKYLFRSMILASTLLTGVMSAWSQEAADTAPVATESGTAMETDAAANPDAAPADAGTEKGMSVNIGVDLDKDGEDDRSARISIETEGTSDEDDGPVVARVVRNGVARLLEEHVLTDEDLTDEERREVRDAIEELRGELRRETRDAAREIDEATKELDRAVREKKHAFILHGRKSRAADEDNDDDGGFGVLQMMVAALAISLSLGMPIIIVALILYFMYRRRRLAHDTINQYLASGKEIPPEVMQNLFKDAGSATTPKSNLHKGVVMTALGLGIIICFYAAGIEFFAAFGFIFLFIGLAQLLIWKIEQGKKGEQAQG